MGIHFTQVRQDLLILTLFVVADAVTFIDNQQRKLALEGVKVTGDRLHAAKHHLAVALFTLQTGGENVGLQPQRAIFGMVLRDQLFYVRQHQHAPTRHSRQLGNHQTFACAGWQDNHGRRAVAAKMVERGIHGFLLVRAKCKNHDLTTMNGTGNSMP